MRTTSLNVSSNKNDYQISIGSGRALANLQRCLSDLEPPWPDRYGINFAKLPV